MLLACSRVAALKSVLFHLMCTEGKCWVVYCPFREVWSSGVGNQSHHIRGQIQPEDHWGTADHRHQAHSRQHRQEPVCGWVPLLQCRLWGGGSWGETRTPKGQPINAGEWPEQLLLFPWQPSVMQVCLSLQDRRSPPWLTGFRQLLVSHTCKDFSFALSQ